MHADLTPLQDLINSLSPSQRKRLAQKVGMDIRRTAGQRIRKNVDPDDHGFVPRKTQARSMNKGKMFQKLAQARRMKITATLNSVAVTYKKGLDAYIAGVHQNAESARVSRKHNVMHKYAKRELFGITTKDEKSIEQRIKEHLGF